MGDDLQNERPIWERFLPGLSLGHRALCYAEAGSTMDVAWAAADAGAASGTAVLAMAQHAGRGRFQREWIGGHAESLLQSVTVSAGAGTLAALSMCACVAVVRAVRTLAGIECRVKWPNDVHVGGRKLCGVLVETRVDTQGGGLAVVGYGLNLDLDFSSYPELRDAATSLTNETGQVFNILATSDAVLRELDRAVAEAGAGDALAKAYVALVDTVGQRISVHRGGVRMDGVAVGVSLAGALRFVDDAGQEHEFTDGEVTLSAEPS